MDPGRGNSRGTVFAVLSDGHFWVPAGVLVIGLALLAVLGR
jgi:hypothetical protein